MFVSLLPYMFRSPDWPSSGAQCSSLGYLLDICSVSAQPYSGLWPAFCLRCCLYLSTARLDVYSGICCETCVVKCGVFLSCWQFVFVSDLFLTVVVSPVAVGELDIIHQDESYRYQWPLVFVINILLRCCRAVDEPGLWTVTDPRP